MKTGWVTAGTLSAVLLVAVASTSAQTTWQPPAPRNLQIVPKDTDPARLVGMMKGFSAALGVGCQHCHQLTGADPKDLAGYDFASDAVPAKGTARKMIQVVQRINVELVRDIGAPRPPGQLKVGCYTCHRGALQPAVSPAGF
jgi:hypothetical protein